MEAVEVQGQSRIGVFWAWQVLRVRIGAGDVVQVWTGVILHGVGDLEQLGGVSRW